MDFVQLVAETIDIQTENVSLNADVLKSLNISCDTCLDNIGLERYPSCHVLPRKQNNRV